MKNLAGTGDDQQAKKELEEAGIEIFVQPEFFANNNECQLVVVSFLGPWSFNRCWYYWSVTGPGINIEQAITFNKQWGKEVRAAGCSGGIEDLYDYFKGFAVSSYHIDSQEGLNAFVKLLKQIMQDAETKRNQK